MFFKSFCDFCLTFLISNSLFISDNTFEFFGLVEITNKSESIDCFISFDALFVNVTAKTCLKEKSSPENNFNRIFFLKENVFPVPALASIILYLYDNFLW